MSVLFLCGLCIGTGWWPFRQKEPDSTDYLERFAALQQKNEGCEQAELQWLRFEWEGRQITWLIPAGKLMLKERQAIYYWDEPLQVAYTLEGNTAFPLKPDDPAWVVLQQIRKQLCPWILPFRNWQLYREIAEWHPVSDTKGQTLRADLYYALPGGGDSYEWCFVEGLLKYCTVRGLSATYTVHFEDWQHAPGGCRLPGLLRLAGYTHRLSNLEAGFEPLRLPMPDGFVNADEDAQNN